MSQVHAKFFALSHFTHYLISPTRKPYEVDMIQPILPRKALKLGKISDLGKSHGRRSLVGCSPWGREESDTTERLHFHFSLSCIGEGNGDPLQCSCLENPRDGGAWWAAVYGVAQSRTRLKRLSSSSSSSSRAKYTSNGKEPTLHPLVRTLSLVYFNWALPPALEVMGNWQLWNELY